jgi:hypothetical protein
MTHPIDYIAARLDIPREEVIPRMRDAADLSRPFYQDLIKEYQDDLKEYWVDKSSLLRLQQRLQRLGITLS